MIALAFPRKAMHCSICLMNSSLYMHEISQIRSTPDKVGLCGITKAMLAGTATFHSPAGNLGQAKKELIARPGHGNTAWHGTPRR